MDVRAGTLLAQYTERILIFLRIILMIAGDVNDRLVEPLKPFNALIIDTYIAGCYNKLCIRDRRLGRPKLQMNIGKIVDLHD